MRAAGRWLSATRSLVAIVIATAGLLGGAAAAPPEAAATGPEARILVMVRMEPMHFRPDVDYGDGYAGRAALAARQRTARAIARAHGLQLLSHWPMPAIGVECYEMQLPPGASLQDALAAIARDDRAAWAQPMHVFSSRAYSDPLYGLQPTASTWQLHRLHGLATGRGVLIAQVDSGVEVEHPDLRGQFHAVQNSVAQSAYAAEQHGTAIAGIIVARAGNGMGIVGVAPAARLLVLRGCREGTAGTAVCDTLALAKALQAALDRQARIVNLSVGGPPDRLLGALLDAALARGMIVVAAASADGRDGGFPASHTGVIAVTDTAAPMLRAALAAAGTDVPTTLPGARWGLVSGSSFAAAAVSGVAALLLELQPGADAQQIDALLGIRPQSVAAGGSGAPQVVDACRSVARAAARCACDCAEAAASTAMNPSGLPASELVGTPSNRAANGLASP
jgi:subtilisin family serine protease